MANSKLEKERSVMHVLRMDGFQNNGFLDFFFRHKYASLAIKILKNLRLYFVFAYKKQLAA
jgi:adenylate cyclase